MKHPFKNYFCFNPFLWAVLLLEFSIKIAISAIFILTLYFFKFYSNHEYSYLTKPRTSYPSACRTPLQLSSGLVLAPWLSNTSDNCMVCSSNTSLARYSPSVPWIMIQFSPFLCKKARLDPRLFNYRNHNNFKWQNWF